MGKLVVMDHPLIQHKISLIRDKSTGTKDFRELVEEIAMLMAYEVTRDLPLKEVEIETPVARAKTKTWNTCSTTKMSSVSAKIPFSYDWFLIKYQFISFLPGNNDFMIFRHYPGGEVIYTSYFITCIGSYFFSVNFRFCARNF